MKWVNIMQQPGSRGGAHSIPVILSLRNILREPTEQTRIETSESTPVLSSIARLAGNGYSLSCGARNEKVTPCEL